MGKFSDVFKSAQGILTTISGDFTTVVERVANIIYGRLGNILRDLYDKFGKLKSVSFGLNSIIDFFSKSIENLTNIFESRLIRAIDSTLEKISQLTTGLKSAMFSTKNLEKATFGSGLGGAFEKLNSTVGETNFELGKRYAGTLETVGEKTLTLERTTLTREIIERGGKRTEIINNYNLPAINITVNEAITPTETAEEVVSLINRRFEFGL